MCFVLKCHIGFYPMDTVLFLTKSSLIQLAKFKCCSLNSNRLMTNRMRIGNIIQTCVDHQFLFAWHRKYTNRFFFFLLETIFNFGYLRFLFALRSHRNTFFFRRLYNCVLMSHISIIPKIKFEYISVSSTTKTHSIERSLRDRYLIS